MKNRFISEYANKNIDWVKFNLFVIGGNGVKLATILKIFSITFLSKVCKWKCEMSYRKLIFSNVRGQLYMEWFTIF